MPVTPVTAETPKGPALSLGEGDEVPLADVLRLAKSHLCLSTFDEVADILLVERELRRRDIDTTGITDEELQAAVDDWRRGQGLLLAEDVAGWLAREGASESDLENLGGHLARRRILRRHLATDAAIQAWLDGAEGRGWVSHSRIAVDNRGLAAELLRMAREEGADFAQLAGAYSLEASGASRGGRVELIQLKELSLAVREALLSLPAGGLAGPLSSGGLWLLLRRERCEASALSDGEREAIADALFDEWLSSQRRNVRKVW
jgi:hypothetical protein